MKNIILQHWTGEMDQLGEKSSSNIQRYANKVSADYQLLRGNVFNPNLCSPMQKLFMLGETFDEYDFVVMLDIDMFTRKGMEDNIFDPSITGVGMTSAFQEHLFTKVQRRHPRLTNPKYPYWGGAIYKLPRELRQKLRVHIKEKELLQFKGTGNYQDEGAMHRLATLAKVPKQKLPDDRKWCFGSYEEGIEQSAIIHVRPRMKKDGVIVRAPKMDVYADLITRGLIE